MTAQRLQEAGCLLTGAIWLLDKDCDFEEIVNDLLRLKVILARKRDAATALEGAHILVAGPERAQ